jgi:hypothetical protein
MHGAHGQGPSSKGLQGISPTVKSVVGRRGAAVGNALSAEMARQLRSPVWAGGRYRVTGREQYSKQWLQSRSRGAWPVGCPKACTRHTCLCESVQ